MAEDGGGKNASRSGETTAPDLLGKESGNSGGMGGIKAFLWCMRKGDRIRVRGEALGVVVDTGGSRETDEGHIRIDFGGSKGSLAKGIHQAWQEQGSA